MEDVEIGDECRRIHTLGVEEVRHFQLGDGTRCMCDGASQRSNGSIDVGLNFLPHSTLVIRRPTVQTLRVEEFVQPPP